MRACLCVCVAWLTVVGRVSFSQQVKQLLAAVQEGERLSNCELAPVYTDGPSSIVVLVLLQNDKQKLGSATSRDEISTPRVRISAWTVVHRCGSTFGVPVCCSSALCCDGFIILFSVKFAASVLRGTPIDR